MNLTWGRQNSEQHFCTSVFINLLESEKPTRSVLTFPSLSRINKFAKRNKHLDSSKSEELLGKVVVFYGFQLFPPKNHPQNRRRKQEQESHSASPYLQWTTTGPASEMLSCLWCTSSRKSSTPPGSLGTPWSGQVLKWYCQTVLSVLPWKEDVDMWK